MPTLAAGKLAAKASGTVWQLDPSQPIGVNLEAHDVSYADGATELAGVDFVNVNNLSVTAKRIDADAINVLRPRAKAAREADGALAAAGIRLVPVKAPAATQPLAGPVLAPTATQPAALPTLQLAALPIDIGIKSLRVADASIEWTDAAVTPAAAIKAVATHMQLSNLDTASTKPASLDLAARADGVIQSVTVKGDIVAKPDAPSAKLAITAERLRVGPLASYLPIPIETTAKDDRLRLQLTAGAANAAAGGLSANLRVRDLEFADAAQQPPATLARVDDFALTIDRFDPAADVYAIGQLTSIGVEAYARQSAAGLEAVGIRLPTAKPAATQPVAASQPAKADEPAPASARSVAGDDGRRRP
ncbi:MAG: DUF748 domain-containing protein [Tepidisphaeraceae bacterium]